MSRRRKRVVLEQVPVTDFAAGGKTIARVDGKVIFIQNGAVPGDVVDLLLYKNKKDYAEGKAIKYHEYSKDRVEPFCEHFGICGGCQWQMLPYEKQMEYKQEQVLNTLQHVGHLTLPKMNPIIGASKTRFYRNKLEFTFSNKSYLTDEEMEAGKEKGDALGFHVPRRFDKILNIQKCHLQPEPSNEIRNEVRRFALEKGYDFYDLRGQKGWLRNLIIRISTLNEVMVNLVVAGEKGQQLAELLDHIKQTFPAITTLLYTINSKKNDSILDLEPQVYYGPGFIKERLGTYIFKIGPKSFFQTNTEQAKVLYDVVKSFTDGSGKEVLYDLYCGTGSIGIYLSETVQKVVGVELVAEAVHHAKENADLNQVANIAFFEGDVIDICDDAFFEKNGRPDVIVTDPPRAGMHKKLVTKLLEIGASKIVYVSCNPATQARDLELLSEQYEISALQPVDLFPQTKHIENVALLRKI